MRQPIRKSIIAWVLATVLAGCSFNPLYQDLHATGTIAPTGPQKMRDFDEWVAAQPATLPETAVIVTFSGGGQRAATMAYYTLFELRDRKISQCAKDRPAPCTLFDNIILVSGISGGAFTAVKLGVDGFAFAQPGDELNQEYKNKILTLNLTVKAGAIILEPWYWPHRTEKFIDNLNANDFLHHAKYADLFADADFHKRPFLLLGSTEVLSGRSFEFTQDTFDDLCAELGKLDVARAVAAAGNLPYILNGVHLENYNATAGCALSEFHTPNDALFQALYQPGADLFLTTQSRYRLWMRAALPSGTANVWNPNLQLDPNYGDYQRNKDAYAEFLRTPDQRKVSYLHLVDGGMADNLGLRHVVNSLAVDTTLKNLQTRGVKQILLIEVNARSDQYSSAYQQRSGDDLLGELLDVPFGAIDRTTELSSDEAQRDLDETFRKLTPDDGLPKVYFMRVDPDMLTGDKGDGDRESFQNISLTEAIGDRQFTVIRSVAEDLFKKANRPCLYAVEHPDQPDNPLTAGCITFVPGVGANILNSRIPEFKVDLK